MPTINNEGCGQVEPDKNKSERLLAIDGLRGLAALAVVLFHLSGNMNEIFHQSLPGFVAAIFKYGYLGVPVFFVLSGFVIAHAVASRRVSLSYVGVFVVRRSIRLDPPYWAAIALAVAMLLIKQNILDEQVSLPSYADVFFHMFYLQDLLQIDPVLSSVFWTLCLEIQFYIFFVLSIYFVGRAKVEHFHFLHTSFLLITGLLSLFIYVDILPFSIKGTFFPYWHFFVSGVILQRALAKSPGYQIFIGCWLLLIFTAMLYHTSKSYLLTELMMILFIYIMGLTNKLKTGLNFSPLQFLGVISYSLYLVHPEIGWKIISVLQTVTKDQQSLMTQIAIFFAGLGGSIFFAYIFYLIVEKTSLQFARRIKLKN